MKPETAKYAWAVAEHSGNSINQVTWEVIGFARKVSSFADCKLMAVVLDDNPEKLAGEIASAAGCDVIAAAVEGLEDYNSDVYRKVLKILAEEFPPRFIVAGHTSTGFDFAPALAVDMEASCITGASEFNPEGRPVFTRAVCCGKVCEDVEPARGTVTVVTVAPGAQSPPDWSPEESGDVFFRKFEAPESSVKNIGRTEADKGTVNLEDAEVIVAVGRGAGDPDRIDPARELASLFNRGAVAASRPVCDAGWLPPEHQVGMTGRTVSPKLYIAAGISGALQHTAGMKNSNLIVSINTDKNAPFCRTAHYCITEDMHRFIPALIEKIRELRQNS